MRLAPIALVSVFFAGSALAAPVSTTPSTSRSAVVCLDTLGTPHPALCSSFNASRIQTEPDICHCGPALRQVSTSWCAPGEASAPDSLEANQARLAAAKAHGSLAGQSFEGRSFCVRPGLSG